MKENPHTGKRRPIEHARRSFRTNMRAARSIWGVFSILARMRLRELTEQYQVSIAAGDLQLLSGSWYITHAGLLRIAYRRRCAGIRVTLVDHRSDPSFNRWIFKAIVYKAPGSKGFVGYGDADPSNVSPRVRGAEMRVAETRAVNRALRKAYGIGLCSVEELGWLSETPKPMPARGTSNRPYKSNGSSTGNGQPPLPFDPSAQS
jgi:hypothetical protein